MAPTVLISMDQLPGMAKTIARTLMADLKAKRIGAINIGAIYKAIDKTADATVLIRSRRETLADMVAREIVEMVADRAIGSFKEKPT